MIKKSIFSFIFFAALHALVVSLSPGWGVGTHQWQENAIRAQHFLYEADADTVIIGTSLSARVLLDSMPGVASCAFSACVVEDGLRLLLSKSATPRVVLMETNYMLRPSNGDLLRANLDGPMPWLRRYVPSLREQNSPICLLGGCTMRGVLAPSGDVDTVRLALSIDSRIADDHTHLLSEAGVKERLSVLLPLIDSLKARGATFVLYEMPLNKHLEHVASNDQTRHVVDSVFPATSFRRLPNAPGEYLTNDGEHLDAEGQRRYSHFFRLALQEL